MNEWAMNFSAEIKKYGTFEQSEGKKMGKIAFKYGCVQIWSRSNMVAFKYGRTQIWLRSNMVALKYGRTLNLNIGHSTS